MGLLVGLQLLLDGMFLGMKMTFSREMLNEFFLLLQLPLACI